MHDLTRDDRIADRAPSVHGWPPVGAASRFRRAGTAVDDDFVSRWCALVEQTVDPNVFLEPWIMLPALDRLAGASSRVGLFSAENGVGQLVGIVPLTSRRASVGRCWSVWSHTHCFDNTPLIRASCDRTFLDSLFDWLGRGGARVIEWPALPADTTFSKELISFIAQTGRAWCILRRSERALLDAGGLTVDQYLAALSGHRRRSLARRRRRLAELGRLDWRQHGSQGDILEGCRRFMALEAQGWKGRLGSAIGCRPEERAFFEEAAARGSTLGGILVNSLELDGLPIAIVVNLRAGDRVWAFKIAYDERLRHCAPGVIAAIEDAQGQIADPSISWVDSCTHPEDQLLNELWPHRRPLVSLLVAVRPGARVELRAYEAMHASFASLRSLARPLAPMVKRLTRGNVRLRKEE